jgi:hypothetical protein
MKRASLSNAPALPHTEPADLTDRLLQPETVRLAASTPPEARQARRAHRRTPTSSQPVPAAPAEAEAAAPGSPRAAAGMAQAEDDAPVSLDEALRQAEAASLALRKAARSGQARFELGLRYRLDALAHHVRQVADFVAASSRR